MRYIFILLISAGFSTFLAGGPVRADDRHAGYYYPTPQTSEVYQSQLAPIPTMDRRSRVVFTIGLSEQQLARAFAPRYHLFAKGEHAQKMIIVATSSGHYNTLYRLRGLLAALTSQARTSPLFSQTNQLENLNFLDLATLAGFTQITLTDGEQIAHRISLASEH